MSKLSETTLISYVSGISVIGPGLTDWSSSRPILTGNIAYQLQPTIFPIPLLLPAAERRRSGDLVKLTLAVGLEATQNAALDPASLACVYTSSSGDGKNCHEICKTLASEDRQISPTRFHNSVHNAAVGYWSIATGAKTPISVLCAFDASFGAGLLEAATQVVANQISTLLIACDTSYPEPLNSVRTIPEAFGIAFVLTPEISKNTLAKIKIYLTENATSNLAQPVLEHLRKTIPAARSLPLLVALAQRQPITVVLDYLEHLHIAVEITPC